MLQIIHNGIMPQTNLDYSFFLYAAEDTESTEELQIRFSLWTPCPLWLKKHLHR